MMDREPEQRRDLSPADEELAAMFKQHLLDMAAWMLAPVPEDPKEFLGLSQKKVVRLAGRRSGRHMKEIKVAHNQPQVEIQVPDAEAQAQQQEAFNIGLDLQLRIKALEFAKGLLDAGAHPKRIYDVAGTAFNFMKHGGPAPVDTMEDPS